MTKAMEVTIIIEYVSILTCLFDNKKNVTSKTTNDTEDTIAVINI